MDVVGMDATPRETPAEPNAQMPSFRHFNLALLAIVLVSLIPRLLLATSQFVEYDGYWHVWIAMQDRWANFLREYQTNAHPPLYFLFLRISLFVGKTPLVYRSVSLITGSLSIYVLGRSALKAMRSPYFALSAALAYGLALPAIVISNEVRTYMLSAILAQISFYYFLDLIPARSDASLGPRARFAVAASLACLTEYYALLYAGAAFLIAFSLPLLRREGRWGRALLRELATFILVFALPVAEFVFHFGGQVRAYDHLPDYYYKPDGVESAIEFIMRNLRNELNWFSPKPIPEGTPFYAVLAALLAGAIVLVILLRKWRALPNLAALVSLALPVLMLGAIVAASLIRAYPFGGFLRQQFLLFPFAVVCLFLLPDRILATFDGKPSCPRWLTPVIAAILAVVVSAVNVDAYEAWPKVTERLLANEMNRYNRLFPNAPAVFLDQYNLTSFFLHHDDWDWSFISPLPGSQTVDVYKLSRANRTMFLFRDKEHWNLDLRDPQLYQAMAAGTRIWHLPATTILGLAQAQGKPRTQTQVEAFRARVAELSAAAGLCVQTLELENFDAWAEFRRAGDCAR